MQIAGRQKVLRSSSHSAHDLTLQTVDTLHYRSFGAHHGRSHAETCTQPITSRDSTAIPTHQPKASLCRHCKIARVHQLSQWKVPSCLYGALQEQAGGAALRQSASSTCEMQRSPLQNPLFEVLCMPAGLCGHVHIARLSEGQQVRLSYKLLPC